MRSETLVRTVFGRVRRHVGEGVVGQSRFSLLPPARVTVFVAVAAVATMIANPTALAAFPGRDGLIAFDEAAPTRYGGGSRGVDYTQSEIFVMDSKGRRAHQLTRPDHTIPPRDVTCVVNQREPSFSPDGKYIAFERLRACSFSGERPPMDDECSNGPGTQCYDSIFIMRADGSRVRRLRFPLEPAAPEDGANPSYFPDGRHIVFDSAGRALEMTTAGSRFQVLPISVPYATLYQPVISPTGGELAFWSTDMGTCGGQVTDSFFAVFTVRTDGSNLRDLTLCDGMPLTIGGTVFGSIFMSPGFSPSGDEIAFANLIPQAPGHPWLMRADGSEAREISDLNIDPLQPPAFAPDGRQIIVTGISLRELVIMDTDGSHVRFIHCRRVCSHPNWGPKPQ